MRTVTLLSVINAVAFKVLGTSDNLPQQQGAAFIDSIGEHLRECWERFFWPEWTVTEERYYRDAWAAQGYNTVGTEVHYTPGDAYYRSNAVAGMSDVPGVSSKWDLITGTDLRRYVSLDQTGKTPIGTVEQVTPKDPRIYPGTPRIGWAPGPDGLEFPSTEWTGTSVWVRFRKRPSQFTATAYNAANAYAVGDLVYFTDGDCYVCTATASAGDTPATDADKWTKQSFPYVLKRAVVLFAAADHRDEDGQIESNSVFRTRAEDALADEWAKAHGQQDQTRRFRVVTRQAA